MVNRILERPSALLGVTTGLAIVVMAPLPFFASPGQTMGATLTTTYVSFRTGQENTLFRDIAAERLSLSGQSFGAAGPISFERRGDHTELDRLLLPAGSRVSVGYRGYDRTVEIRVDGAGAPIEAQIITRYRDAPAGEKTRVEIDPPLQLDSALITLTAPSDQVGIVHAIGARDLNFSVIQHQGAMSFATSALLGGRLQFFVAGYSAKERTIERAERINFKLADAVIEHLRFADGGVTVAFAGRPLDVVKQIGDERQSLRPSAFEGLMSVQPIVAALTLLFGAATAFFGISGFKRP